jgi:acyl-CoA synthetase (AMP-forming)/AMP-acid ligase II
VALTVSPAIKVFALLGMLIALVMGGAFFVMGGSQETVDASAPMPTLAPKKKVKVVEAPAVAKKTAAAANARVNRAAAPSASPVAKPKRVAVSPKAPRKAQLNHLVATNGLPVSIMRALALHDVVVVSLYGGGWKIDPMARDEAAAGARSAGAGFVALDVTTVGRAAEALMLKYDTVFRAPAVLVFRGRGELALQLDGFRDRDTVAQAAMNARS